MSAAAAYSAATSASLAFIFLIFAACSPWTMYSWWIVTTSNISSWFGVGPFVAGSQTAYYTVGSVTYYGGVVWWNQLNTQNVCLNPNPSVLLWAANNNLCPNGKFAVPPESLGLQACIVLATIFSFLACASGFSVSRSRAGGGGSAACTSFLAMVFSIAAFAIWTTWPMSTNLQGAGDNIPIWVSGTVTGTYTIGVSPKVKLYYGWTYITTICAFVLLLFSTCTFSAVSKRLSEDDGGGFGTGAAGRMI